MQLRPKQETAVNAIATKLASGIYKMYWENCPYYYYGQSVNFGNRWKYHLTNLKTRKHYNKKLLSVVSQYGKPDFEIIEFCETKDLTEKEQYYINLHFNDPFCCNVSPTAGSCKGVTRSEEFKEKLRKANTGKVKSLETRQKISIKKMFLTPQQRANISNAQKGKVSTPEANQKRRDFMLNVGDEYRNKMREVKTGTYTGSQNHASKLVLNTETGIFYDTLKEAAAAQTKYSYAYCKLMVAGSQRNKTPFIYA